MLGLAGHPRAIVIHEKNGRRHAHAVWSRIDAEEMKAVNLPFFKTRLTELSRELYLEHDWPLPDGLRQNGGKSPLNFTLAEWQQAKRLDLDPRELKQVFRETWERSDGRLAFARAIEERGYFLAQGDRRGHVAVDVNGEVFAVARLTGRRTKEVTGRLGPSDTLPSVAEVQSQIRQSLSDRARSFIQDSRDRQQHDRKPLEDERQRLNAGHCHERAMLQEKQREREHDEQRRRQERFSPGLRGIWDRITGRARDIRTLNESEALKGLERDRKQRDALVLAQLAERRVLQTRFDALKKRHAEERKLLAREIVRHLRKTQEYRRAGPERSSEHAHEHTRERQRSRGPDLSRH